MPWFKWSQTANSNANADPTINWAEGQPPSSINDSARAMMAATAMYRDDVAGAIVTAGTSTAYTVSSFSGFGSLADMNGQQIWFTPHVTNGAIVTLNVDGLGLKPLRSAPNTELPAGVLIHGTPYGAVYNNTDGAWYLKGFFGNPAFSTGDVKPTLKTVADPGWVMGGANTTIGNVGSGANFADASALALYTLIWNNVSSPTGNAFCAVTGGLGASAAADWAGLKPISVGWWTGHALGLAGGGGGLTVRALGSNVGTETNALSSTNQLPQFTPSGSVSTATTLSSTNSQISSSANGSPSALSVGTAGAAANLAAIFNATLSSISTFVGNAIGLASPASFSIMQPTIFVNAMIKL